MSERRERPRRHRYASMGDVQNHPYIADASSETIIRRLSIVGQEAEDPAIPVLSRTEEGQAMHETVEGPAQEQSRRPRRKKKLSWGQRLLRQVQRERVSFGFCVVFLVIIMGVGCAMAKSEFDESRVQKDLDDYARRTAFLDSESLRIEQELELATDAVHIRSEATKLQMLRAEKVKHETIYIQPSDVFRKSEKETEESQSLDGLGFMLALLDILHIGE